LIIIQLEEWLGSRDSNPDLLIRSQMGVSFFLPEEVRSWSMK